MLYIATSAPLQEQALPHGFSVQSVPPDRSIELSRAFSMPHVRFVGHPGGCSCDLPHVLCDQVIEYYDGMLEPEQERQAEVSLVRGLLDLAREGLQSGTRVELYPVWAGSEGLPPKGRIELRVSCLKAVEFFFIEQFLYAVAT
jgi:hypothetical protein